MRLEIAKYNLLWIVKILLVSKLLYHNASCTHLRISPQIYKHTIKYVPMQIHLHTFNSSSSTLTRAQTATQKQHKNIKSERYHHTYIIMQPMLQHHLFVNTTLICLKIICLLIPCLLCSNTLLHVCSH